mmetsp:Transcript_41788/g.83123  ORF Transcript_41788/g.83123 Transcript_41788/m.83123 type:complete len:210 (+) Transcript_41788:5088-5717(+)
MLALHTSCLQRPFHIGRELLWAIVTGDRRGEKLVSQHIGGDGDCVSATNAALSHQQEVPRIGADDTIDVSYMFKYFVKKQLIQITLFALIIHNALGDQFLEFFAGHTGQRASHDFFNRSRIHRISRRFFTLRCTLLGRDSGRPATTKSETSKIIIQWCKGVAEMCTQYSRKLLIKASTRFTTNQTITEHAAGFMTHNFQKIFRFQVIAT